MKNFKQMSTKKLQALMETASEEDRMAIQEVLNARQQVAAKASVEEPEEEALTPEEEEAIAAAEANGGINPLFNGSKTGRQTKEKMSEEELHTLAKELKEKYLNHKCQAVPFGTIDWIDGYIAGIVEEKRSRKILYRIRLIDGRTINKIYDNNLLRIFDEVVEKPEKPEKPEKAKRERVARKAKFEMPEEEIAAKVAECRANIGKHVSFKPFGKEEEVLGRITGFMLDRRGPRFLYKIDYVNNEGEAKHVHKGADNCTVVNEELDEVGQKLQERVQASRSTKTPADTLAAAEEKLQKLEAKLTDLQKAIEAQKQKVEELKAKTIEAAAAEIATAAEIVTDELA